MKKFSKTIAAFSMSLLTVGAFGQVPARSLVQAKGMIPINASNAKEMPVLHQVNGDKTKAPMTGPTHLILAYFNTDAAIVGSSSYAYFVPPAFTNTRYNATTDTSVGSNKNYNGYHSSIVAFDTLVDVGDNTWTAVSGSLKVDTIFLNLGYRNTSTTNDTLVVHIGSVSAKGYPTGTFYTNDTVVVPPHSSALPGNVLDSIYEIFIIPNGGAGYIIPPSAPKGYKFDVSVEVYGSKLDTLGEFYGAPDFSCGGYGYALHTQVGPSLGAAPNVNSYMTGFLFYNSAAFSGDGAVLTWPDMNGGLSNSHGSFGDAWAIPACGVGEDTGYLYFQDVFTAVAIDYYDNTGVSKIASNGGLSVGQNYPNPFNKETTITYSLTKSSDVTFTVYDVTGRVIANNTYGSVAPGQYQINLSANTFSPGIYFYTFNVNGSTVTKKMVITE